MSKTEDFKRPNHPDFMDSTELKKAKWSGYRMNSLTNCAEIWLEGECRASISPQDLVRNPHAVQEAMENIFALDKALPDTPDARAYGKQLADEQSSPIILLSNTKH